LNLKFKKLQYYKDEWNEDESNKYVMHTEYDTIGNEEIKRYKKEKAAYK